MMERHPPVIIGIVGDSAAGKTTLARGIAEILGRDRTLAICIDDYHRYDRATRAVNGLTPHDPACNYLDILEQHVALLRAGQPILKPVYNHAGGVLEAPVYVEPKPFIILEGLLGCALPALIDVYDVKLYLEPQEAVRMRWKLQRDVGHSGYTPAEVQATVARLRADSERYVIPQRRHADMIVGFCAPEGNPGAPDENLNCGHILRPTLPHLDLTPLLEAGQMGAITLDLARDIDGRPVDILHVAGCLDDSAAQALEAALWQQIPGETRSHARIGLFTDRHGTDHRSAPLALSQLLITHYLLTAASGHRARNHHVG